MISFAGLQYWKPSVNSRQSLFGIGWMTLAQGTGMVLRLGSSVILTRLLAPEAYGTIGPALVLLMTLEWFSDLGLRQVLVRDERGGSIELLSAGWWIGLFRAIGLAAIVASLAWPLQEFYAQPGLAGVLLALSLLPILQALRSPGLPVLRREMNYRAVFVIEFGQIASSIFCTLIAAWILHTVWALAIGILAGAAFEVLLSYWLCPLCPSRSWDRSCFSRLLKISREVMLNTLAMAVVLNSDRLLGLRLISVEQMGLYTVAWNLAGALDSLLSRACDVYYSLLARTPESSRQALHERVCLLVATWGGPLLTVAVVVAPCLVPQLYDTRYRGVGILLSVLMARLILRALGQMQFQHLMVRAEIRIATQSYLAAIVVEAVLMFPLAHAFGALGLALASLVSIAVVTGIQSLGLRMIGQKLLPCGIAFAWTIGSLTLLYLLW